MRKLLLLLALLPMVAHAVVPLPVLGSGGGSSSPEMTAAFFEMAYLADLFTGPVYITISVVIVIAVHFLLLNDIRKTNHAQNRFDLSTLLDAIGKADALLLHWQSKTSQNTNRQYLLSTL